VRRLEGDSTVMRARLVTLCALTAASACVKPYSGSDIQIDFSQATQTAATSTGAQMPNQPAPNTYYILWSSEQAKDPNGAPTATYLFHVVDFEIDPAINTASPCLIQMDTERFPGLHVTEFANKMSEQTGIVDPLNPPAGASQIDITDVLDAERRVGYLPFIAASVKTITDPSTGAYGPSETTCIEDNPGADQTKFPPAKCTGDQSNANRLKLCHEFWSAHPTFFEGSDEVYTAPLNGNFRGMVEGTNPVNGGFLGGSEFVVPDVLTQNAYFVAWQYKDEDGDGQPDFPASTPAADKPNGHLYMIGTPGQAARGVFNVPMANPNDPSIAANMAIFADLADDGTHF
jgi:hypothetical protein